VPSMLRLPRMTSKTRRRSSRARANSYRSRSPFGETKRKTTRSKYFATLWPGWMISTLLYRPRKSTQWQQPRWTSGSMLDVKPATRCTASRIPKQKATGSKKDQCSSASWIAPCRIDEFGCDSLTSRCSLATADPRRTNAEDIADRSHARAVDGIPDLRSKPPAPGYRCNQRGHSSGPEEDRRRRVQRRRWNHSSGEDGRRKLH